MAKTTRVTLTFDVSIFQPDGDETELQEILDEMWYDFFPSDEHEAKGISILNPDAWDYSNVRVKQDND